MTPPPPVKRGRGRPRSFQLTENAGGKKGGRVTRTIDGETVRKRVRLETVDEAVAKIKLQRLAADPTAPVEVATSGVTFLEAARLVNAARVRAGKYRAKDELTKIIKHAFPLHDILAEQVTSKDVIKTLVQAQERGQGKQSCKHLRNYLSWTYDALVNDDDYPSVVNNPVTAAKLPKFEPKLKKERAVLEDSELFVYLKYEHHVPFHQVAVFERQVMSCVARCLGGQRTNDLHEATWDQFAIGDGEFAECWVVHTKGQDLQRMSVPQFVRPFLRKWWERAGRPRVGLIFPNLRGERVGLQKTKVSHAKAFREDLKRAFGLDVWDPRGGQRQSGCWVTVREMTDRERELFVVSRFTLPVDFHSWRRAFVQAVDAVEGLSDTQKRELSAHKTEAMRQVYLRKLRQKRWTVPEGAIPAPPPGSGILGQPPALIPEEAILTSSDSFGDSETSVVRPAGFEPATTGSGVQPASSKGSDSLPSARTPVVEDDPQTPWVADAGLKSRPKIAAPLMLSEKTLYRMLALATQDKDLDLVASLTAQLKALVTSSPPDELAAARARRDRK